jgi:3alpha(or 20beta)-hydroxysteroid dehydrogenase
LPDVELAGKVAIVTGAARGHGAAEARLLASLGASVMLADVNDSDGGPVASGLADEFDRRALYHHLDVSDEAGWNHAVATCEERFGPVSILVNNAGILRLLPIEQLTVDDYRAVVAVNPVGTWLGMRAALPSMPAPDHRDFARFGWTDQRNRSKFEQQHAPVGE